MGRSLGQKVLALNSSSQRKRFTLSPAELIKPPTPGLEMEASYEVDGDPELPGQSQQGHAP